MNGYIETIHTRLRTIRREDLETLGNLMNDRGISVMTGEVYPMTEHKLDDFYTRTQQTNDRVWFVIEDKETGQVIGETGFLRIFMPWRTADFSLMIWNRDFWRRGYGREVSDAMLDYGFNSLNFHRVAIGVVEQNTRAMRFWTNIGFIEEGRQKDGFFRRGEYSDFVMMYMLEGEFRRKHS
jgi:RimJ/RimL family protein N-acetyltransferase